MFIIKYRKIFYCLSIILIVASVAVTAIWGINFGVDFTGGSDLEINFPNTYLDKAQVLETIHNLGLDKEFLVRETNQTGYILKSKTLGENEKEIILEALKSKAGAVEEVRFTSVGPTVGQELRGKAVMAIVLVVLMIIIYIAIAFSQVSKPVSSWKYGFITVLTFVHDVSVPVGLFSVLGHFYGIEVDTLFVIAILVVLGYSVNDTIIVFDRIRENLRNTPENQRNHNFEEIVGTGLRQTFGRSINTSVTAIIALLALVILGGIATRWFSIALIAGIVVGTYSSIFFASPMLVTLNNWQNRKNK